MTSLIRVLIIAALFASVGCARRVQLYTPAGWGIIRQSPETIEFMKINSWEEARDYFLTWIKPMYPKGTYKGVVDYQDSRYRFLEDIVKDLTGGFTDLFPERVKGTPKPYILIISAKKLNASSTMIRHLDKRVNIILVHEPFLALPIDQVRGTLAHELAHAFLGHGEGSFARKYYRPQKGEVKMSGHVNDPKLEKKVKLLTELRAYVGPFSRVELGGIPLHFDHTETHTDYRLVIHLLKHAPKSWVCGKARKYFASWVNDVFEANFSPQNQTLNLATAAARQTARELSRKLEKGLKYCLRGVKVDFLEFAHHVFEPPFTLEHLKAAIPSMPEHDQRILQEYSAKFKTMDAISAIIENGREFRERIRKIEIEIDHTHVRMYTHEDEADEMSIKVLVHMYHDAEALNRFLSFINKKHLGEACDLSTQREPGFGGFEDPHHAHCWRAYRNHKFILKLKHQELAAGF